MADAVEEFRFKLAKAKDLPPSWFELVLVPRKFQEHVIALNGNRKRKHIVTDIFFTTESHL